MQKETYQRHRNRLKGSPCAIPFIETPQMLSRMIIEGLPTPRSWILKNLENDMYTPFLHRGSGEYNGRETSGEYKQGTRIPDSEFIH